MAALTYAGVSYAYDDATAQCALVDVSIAVAAGDLVLVVGASGSGKSTLLRAANGIVPHSTGGRFAGDVRVGDRSTRDHPPRALADAIGFVHQDPEAQFVVDHVESDIAYVLENLGVDPVTMRRRVEEVLDALAIAHLRDRDPATLSGGERQRCAIAGALAAAPGLLVLDEPTSQLDPQGAEDVLAALARLNTDLGTTILLAEHRLERAAPLADRVVRVAHGAIVADGAAAAVLAQYDGAPPVTELGRVLGWDPLPLTVKAARAAARDDVRTHDLAEHRRPVESPACGAARLDARGVEVQRSGRRILTGVDLTVHEGEVIALLGRNGAGKTTLLRALAGLQRTQKGTVTPADGTRVAYVPQDPNVLFSAGRVRSEVEATLRLLHRRDEGAVDAWLTRLDLQHVADRHPRSLSGGERQRLAIAAVAVGGACVLLLDEPTRGMDAPSRDALAHAIAEHASDGGAVVLATHDVELAARVAHRVVVLGDGEVVADGERTAVLAGSLFAPQVLRVLPPFLTVEEVERAWTP